MFNTDIPINFDNLFGAVLSINLGAGISFFCSTGGGIFCSTGCGIFCSTGGGISFFSFNFDALFVLVYLISNLVLDTFVIEWHLCNFYPYFLEAKIAYSFKFLSFVIGIKGFLYW